MKIPLFAHLAAISFFIPVLIGIYKWKQQNNILKLFFFYCCFSGLHVIVEFVFGRMGKPTLGLSNFHQLIELSIILLVYFKYTQNDKVNDVIQYSGLAYILIWIIHKFYFENPEKISEVIQTSGRFLLLSLSIVVLFNIFQTVKNTITNEPVFWIAAGTVLYCTGSIMVVTMGNFIMQIDVRYFVQLWYVNWTFTIIANIFFTRSFLCKTI